MISMILASTFVVPMIVVFVSFFLVSFLENSEPIQVLGIPAPSRGKRWLASNRQAKAQAAIENLMFEIEINEIFEALAGDGWQERITPLPIFQEAASPAEMPQAEFEEMVWACTLPDYAALASNLLSRRKPERGKDGKFVKRVRFNPDPDPKQSEGMAPIPSLFSFFKRPYQHLINILIHINQQFNYTYPSPSLALSIS